MAFKYNVKCPGCDAEVTVAGGDLDAQLDCDPAGNCCLQDHHHGQEAERTGKPCRPVIITAVPDTIMAGEL